MGKPSQKWYSARRPGKRARARVKKHRRSQCFGSVAGAGTYELKAGRKKWDEFHKSKRNPFGWNRSFLADSEDHTYPSSGEPISKVGTQMLNGQSVRQAGVETCPQKESF